MDFFESQEAARARTGRLVALFALAVLGIIAAVYGALVAALAIARAQQGEPTVAVWDARLLAGAAVGVLLVVGLASLVRTAQLRSGGRAVAEMLGGRRLDPGSVQILERRLLNVVEEMAIASGTPAPAVYVLDEEPAINAFAAGHEPGDAVVGVTRGGLEKLSRDELQGVVAHEFGHILNGDMRLNLRLMGLVFGIVVLGYIGYLLLRVPRRGRGRQDGRAVVAILTFGAALFAIGAVGTLFGRMIRAAVSRQRELLADASSVQFTRNPQGLAGALRKIGGLEKASVLEKPEAAEVSHMLFAMGFRTHFRALFATHPPLAERIRRLDPAFDGRFPAVPAEFVAPVEAAPAAALNLAAAPTAKDVLAQIGQPGDAHVAWARELREALPERLTAAARESYGARALVFALLLDPKQETRRKELAVLAARAEPPVLAQTRALEPEVRRLDRRARLPLFDLALPALRELSPAQYRRFEADIRAVIRADDRVELFEWVLHLLVRRHLGRAFEDSGPAEPKLRDLAHEAEPVGVFLGTLACAGHADPAAAQAALAAAYRELPPRVPMPQRRDFRLAELDAALEALTRLAPRPKRVLLRAAAAAVVADREVTPAEGELFRAVADALGCPVPPLLPGQPLA